MGKDFRSSLDELINKSKREKGEGLENETFIYENSFAEEVLEGQKQDRLERKKYARRTFSFLKYFTSSIILILFFSGARGKFWCLDFSLFNLSDAVLITMITTSLATIVGIFAFVMKYLFYKDNNSK